MIRYEVYTAQSWSCVRYLRTACQVNALHLQECSANGLTTSLNAKNYLDKAPTLPPPVYAPDVVAQRILHCAETSTRELFIGGSAKDMAALSYYAPRLMDAVGLEYPSERLAERAITKDT